jgi:hypothetical protein
MLRRSTISHASLIVGHTLGVLAAAIVAVFEIESIVFTGPVLGFTGLLIAVFSFRARRRIGFGFGLTATAAAILWFAIIVSLSWSPGTAHRPVSTFLILFALTSIPWSTFSVSELFSPHGRAAARFQFGLGTMLLITFFEASYLGILRAFGIFARLSAM